MGLFSRKSKPKITNRIAEANASVLGCGGTISGTFVDEDSAMHTSAVYACVKVIAESLASLPLSIYRREERGSKQAFEHSLYNVLHYAPNSEMTSFIYRETLMNHLLIYGNAYSQIIRDGGGRVVSLHPLMPDRMRVSRENGKLIYTYWLNHDERNDGEHESGIITFPKEKILHIPGLGFDGLVGYSPIALAKNAVGMAIAAEEYGASFFANGASPSGVLEHPTSIGKNIDKVREAWDVIHKGAKNSGKIAVLEGGLKYTPLSVSPEEAQFLQTRKFQLNEIARIFRVPPHMIGDLEKSSFNNIEQQSLDFVKHCINPWVTRWEQAMWQNLLSPSEQRSGLYIKFNLDGLMRGDYETRMKGYSIGIQNGFFSPNDIRRLEEMDEIPSEEGGDAFLVNGNMKSVKKAAFGDPDKSDDEVYNEKILELLASRKQS